MQSTALTAPHSFVVFWGIVFLIIGLVIINHEVPQAGCAGGTAPLTEHTDVQNLSHAAGAFSLIAGIVGLIGGLLGLCGSIHQYHRMYANGGFVRRKRCVMCSALFILAAFVLTIIVLGTLGKSYDISKKICDGAICQGGLCSMDCKKQYQTVTDATGTRQEAIGSTCALSYCKADYDSFCDNKPKSIAGLVIIVFFDVCMIVAFGFSSAAGFFCPAKFEMADAPPAEDPEMSNKAGS